MYTFEQATKIANAKTKLTGIYYTAIPCIASIYAGQWAISSRFN